MANRSCNSIFCVEKGPDKMSSNLTPSCERRPISLPKGVAKICRLVFESCQVTKISWSRAQNTWGALLGFLVKIPGWWTDETVLHLSTSWDLYHLVWLVNRKGGVARNKGIAGENPTPM